MEYDQLTADELAALLCQQEGHFLDFKSKRIQPSKASQTVSALANADGGEVYIGIEDAKTSGDRWIGFDNEEAANAHIATLTSLFPPSESFSYTFLTATGATGIVIKIEILKNRQIWSDSSGDHWIRRGAQNLRLDRDQIRQLEYAKGLTSFEDSKLEVSEDYLGDFQVQIEANGCRSNA